MNNMRKTLTKDYILKTWPLNSSCVVKYKDGKTVEYSSLEHVKWKQVAKISLPVKELRINLGNGSIVRRNRCSFLVDN